MVDVIATTVTTEPCWLLTSLETTSAGRFPACSEPRAGLKSTV
jgi:hypothetical protein